MRYLILIPFLLVITACSTVAYYGQSIQGQLSILSKRQDVSDLINNPATPENLKKSLQQAVKIRQYASTNLYLPDNKSYLKYVDLERPYVVWNVFAAPEFSLEPKTWCYFIVGCVSYRGYFAENDAIEMANKLEAEHFDVHVTGIAAYSTLGWFDDPLLNTMMHWNERHLASLIFHELSHQVIYIPGETALNEAFATAVERMGTIQWLLNNNESALAQYLRFLEAQAEFRQLLLTSREKLDNLYKTTMNEEKKRRLKQEIILSMQQEYQLLKQGWAKGISFDGWFSKPVNNARLTAAMTYLQQVPAFYQIFIENKADWNHFYEAVKALEDMDKNERDKLIQAKLSKSPDIEALIQLIKQNS